MANSSAGMNSRGKFVIRPSPFVGWFPALILTLFSTVLLDTGISRVRYHYHLDVYLRPIKYEIQADIYRYHGEVPSELQHCHAFDRSTNSFIRNCTLSACEQNAYMLSEKRQSILNSIREVHPTSKLISEVFDSFRGMNQTEKIERLFKRKPCEGVIESSDRTNKYIDLCAIVTLPLGVYMLWKAVVMVIYRRR